MCFIGTSPKTKLSTKASAYLRKVPGADDEYYFFTGEYDYFWHNCVDSRAIKDLTQFIYNFQPRSVFVSHYMHIGIDLLGMLRLALPDVHLTVGLHEMLFACLADGQMVKKTNGGLCHKAEPELCAMCFPHITADTFMARHHYNRDLLDMVDNCVVPAKHLGEVLQREMGVEARRIHVINHPIDLDRYRARPPESHRRKQVRFGFFGQFVDNKGIHVLLKAGDLVNRGQPPRPFQIVINGGNKNFASGDYQKKIEEMISESQHWEHGEVVELGDYTHDELIQRRLRWM